MELSAATVWWVLAGIAVAVELSTGTFYMLMLALGLAAGAIASHLGFGRAAADRRRGCGRRWRDGVLALAPNARGASVACGKQSRRQSRYR